MNNREMANALVTSLGETLTIADMQLDEQGCCSLLFDGDILLNLEHDSVGERMLFYVYLDEVPEENAEPILREALAANLFWHRTHGAVLALEAGTGGIILTYAHRVADLDAALFETVVQNVVQTAEEWKQRLAELKESGADIPEGGPAPAMGIQYA